MNTVFHIVQLVMLRLPVCTWLQMRLYFAIWGHTRPLLNMSAQVWLSLSVPQWQSCCTMLKDVKTPFYASTLLESLDEGVTVEAVQEIWPLYAVDSGQLPQLEPTPPPYSVGQCAVLPSPQSGSACAMSLAVSPAWQCALGGINLRESQYVWYKRQ